MWIFKYIADRYFKEILDIYQLQADEKTIKGKEAELLIIRNDFANCLIKKINALDVKSNEDQNSYFNRVHKEINSGLDFVKNSVLEYNTQYNTEFTTDLFESVFTFSLTSLTTAIHDLYKKSPPILIDISDENLFRNSNEVPWIYQFSSALYEYILQKELELATKKEGRDIFDSKKQLIYKYIPITADHCSRFEKGELVEEQYNSHMNALLQGMRSEDHDLQQRRSADNKENSANTSGYGMFNYFSQVATQTYHKASEKIMGKGKLGTEIENLIEAFNQRAVTTKLVL